MATKKLSILGSTGSIGRQTLSLIDDLNIEVTAISGFQNTALLEEQALRYRPRYVCAVDPNAASGLKTALAHTDIQVLSGSDGLCRMVEEDGSDTVLTAIVGVAGLLPTLAAIKGTKNIALANKETLVAGGALVTELAEKYRVRLLPVDSEHSAIFQCLQDPYAAASLRRIVLTASGGPFFGFSRQQLSTVTVQQALRHPNWSMGKKISVDSATMMNKGLELIEAMWLFGLGPEEIEVAVHRQSIVHSMVEFSDGSMLAQLGTPDMRLPIQYALTWPERRPCPAERLSIRHMASLTFELPDEDAFGCLAHCRSAAGIGGTAPAAANAANEEAVAWFLAGRIGFLDIEEAVGQAVNRTAFVAQYSAEDLLLLDREVRIRTREYLTANEKRSKL